MKESNMVADDFSIIDIYVDFFNQFTRKSDKPNVQNLLKEIGFFKARKKPESFYELFFSNSFPKISIEVLNLDDIPGSKIKNKIGEISKVNENFHSIQSKIREIAQRYGLDVSQRFRIKHLINDDKIDCQQITNVSNLLYRNLLKYTVS